MSLPVYHYLHLIGLIVVFIGVGSLLTTEGTKSAFKWCGTGLLISLVSGFGMLAKYSQSLPADAPSLYTQKWVLLKMGLWLVLGFLPVLAKRRVMAPRTVVIFAVAVGAVLAYLGYFKPA